MPEPFKNMLNKQVIRGMAQHFRRHWPEFNEKGFVLAATRNLDTLELKQRTDRITEKIHQYLPPDFAHAADILLNSLGTELQDDLSASCTDENGIGGWAIMPMAQYVGLHGQPHFEVSMQLLKEMTKRASSEFAIRYFLTEASRNTLAVMNSWVDDPNHHVRRLVSEGSRPRLPWGMRLPDFIADPTPVIKLLEKLKDDESEYVRRSVANNLNDISKDHPDLVADIAARWLQKNSPARHKLVHHACRTLLKQGHKNALRAFGYRKPYLRPVDILLHTPAVEFGDSLEFSVTIESSKKSPQSLLIDYIIHHQKANGSTSPKVFKWKTLELLPNQTVEIHRRHALKKVTTRVYYPGSHAVEILINGVSCAKTGFTLEM